MFSKGPLRPLGCCMKYFGFGSVAGALYPVLVAGALHSDLVVVRFECSSLVLGLMEGTFENCSDC